MPCVVERERLMGFHGIAVTSSELKHSPRGSQVVRACLLGGAFHVEVLTWFFAHVAVKMEVSQCASKLCTSSHWFDPSASER